MKPLFLMHNEFKETMKRIIEPKSYSNHPVHDTYAEWEYEDLRSQVLATIESVISTLNSRNDPEVAPIECSRARDILKAHDDLGASVFGGDYPNVTIYQPYISIALAFLLEAHGASDEAVSILAEWLWAWEQLDGYKKKSPGCTSNT